MNQISGCQYIVAFIHTDFGSAASALANCYLMVSLHQIRFLSNLPDQTMAFIVCQAEMVFHVTARFNEIDVDHLSGDRLDRIPEFFAPVSAVIQVLIIKGGGGLREIMIPIFLTIFIEHLAAFDGSP